MKMQNKNKKRALKLGIAGLVSLLCLSCFSALALSGGGKAETDGNNASVAVKTPASLWDVDSGMSVKGNVDVPSWCKQGYRYGEDITESDLQDWEKNGVQISSETEAGYATFSNVIDIDGFTKHDRLVEVLPLTSVRGASDFTSLTVVLTDADDESNWISVQFRAINLRFNQGGAKAVVETSNGLKGGKKWGWEADAIVEMGTELQIGGFYHTTNPVEGKTVNDMAVLPYSVRYDVEENRLYSFSREGKLVYLYDLDDEEQTGVGKEWKGFTNNRIKVSLRFGSISSAPSSLIVLNVANNGMNGETIVDDAPPSGMIKFPGEVLPVGMVGKAYKLFPAEFNDFHDGVLDYEVAVKAPDGEYENVLSDTFTPTSVGAYTLRYTATDGSGNVTKLDCTVDVCAIVPSINVEIADFEASALVGESVALPQITATGGSGELTFDVKVLRVSDGKEIQTQNGSFLPLFAGDYDIVYTVTDYLGNTATASAITSITASKRPILKSELIMYEQFVDGVTVELPTVNAYDYDSIAGQALKAKTEITVKGTGEKSGYSETLSDYLFTPTKEKFGESVVVEYKVYCSAYVNNALQIPPFTVNIIEPTAIEEYFDYDSESVALATNEKSDDEQFLRMTALQNGTQEIRFSNPLRAENFEFLFSVEDGKEGFEFLELTLVDVFDSTACIRFSIQKWNENNTYVYYQGEKRAMSGGFHTDAPLLLKYRKQFGLVDYTGNVLFELNDFTGFPSGRVWAYVTLKNASENSAVQLKTLGTQSLGARYRASGKVAFSDSLSPVLELTSALTIEPKLGERVGIPSVRVFDVCKPYLEAYYTLIAPNGETLVDKEKVTGTQSFIASSYGEYQLVYTANDGKNEGQAVYSIFVFDYTAPIIFYNGEVKITAKSGDVLQAKSLEAYDAYDGKVDVYVYVISPNGKITGITDTLRYKLTETGKYTLRYYAYDKNYNYAFQDVEIQVE